VNNNEKESGDFVKAELPVIQSPLSEKTGVYMTRGIIEGFKAEGENRLLRLASKEQMLRHPKNVGQ